MRNSYIVCYDIADDKRVKKMFKVMRRFGSHIQFSVFQCELSRIEKVKLVSSVKEVMNEKEDQVLLIDIGPAPGRSDDCIEYVGRPYTHPERHARVL